MKKATKVSAMVLGNLGVDGVLLQRYSDVFSLEYLYEIVF